jgi:protein farnesyltransferase/geranylgeranyltransferase type-1 subunit alpha
MELEDNQEPKYIFYKHRPEWSDVTPVKEFSSNVEILKIDYNESIEDANNYFRAILQSNELSERAYHLTMEIIETCPTNYMAWYHRRKCVEALNIDLEEEMDWLDSIAKENQKNYQIWQHRKILIEKTQDSSREKKMLDSIFDDEPKNFHAWCHRIWVVRRFDLYEGEYEFVNYMLDQDIRNNSVWNYRYFLFNHTKEKSIENFTSEIEYTLDKIKQVPANESPYNYIRGLIGDNKLQYSKFPVIKELLLEIPVEENNYHALALLLDIYEEEKNIEKFNQTIDKLIQLDWIRRKYYEWRRVNRIE